MSIHPSLKLSEKDKKQRSVLKRSERLKIMLEKNEWKPKDKIFGLPKIKTLKIKIKKEKAEKKEEAGSVEGVVTPPTGQAPAKGQAAKSQEKNK